MIYDTTDVDTEAIETLRHDVDLEMAEMADVGRAADAAYAARRCPHFGVVGYMPEPHREEQKTLKPGQLACTEHLDGCNAVFDSDEAWDWAMHDALYPDM